VGDLALGDFALGDFSYWAISPGGRFLLVGDFSCFRQNGLEGKYRLKKQKIFLTRKKC